MQGSATSLLDRREKDIHEDIYEEDHENLAGSRCLSEPSIPQLLSSVLMMFCIKSESCVRCT